MWLEVSSVPVRVGGHVSLCQAGSTVVGWQAGGGKFLRRASGIVSV